ncbi:MAG: hypothetical protein J5I94_14025 [Phaeodactylibacter sp.]|nr:hypothetical protein [Phaeodactylibacter sp.]
MKKDALAFLAFFLFALGVSGQEQFPNTLFFTDTTTAPGASLADMGWIEGHWMGEAFGGITEEVWTPPLGGSMMCAFKLVVNDQVKFYELVTIAEENGSLILRLKHFHPGLEGWEEKDDVVEFKLVKVAEGKVYFDGFTFERVSEEEMNIYVVIQRGEEKAETKFNYQRVSK